MTYIHFHCHVIIVLGSVYIYDVGGSSLVFQQKITAFDDDGSGNNRGDAFGFSLSILANSLAVSAFDDDDGGHESGLFVNYTI